MPIWKTSRSAGYLGAILGVIAVIAGCPSAGSDTGCDNPFPGEDFCGACNGTCYYCPTNACTDPCDLDAGFNCLAVKSDSQGTPAPKAKPAVLSLSKISGGSYQLTVDSGLNAPAEVSWFSSLEGQVETTGSIGTLCLNTPGIHALTYSAKPGGGGERIMSEPVMIELR